MTTLVRSLGVPSLGESTSIAADIREKPGRGAGEPLLTDARPEEESRSAALGAGRVMKPVKSIWGAAVLSAFFFLFFLSVLPFDSGWASRNSAAWGTALEQYYSV